MIKLELTLDQAEALNVLLGQMNYYEKAAILCKVYSEQGLERANTSLISLYRLVSKSIDEYNN